MRKLFAFIMVLWLLTVLAYEYKLHLLTERIGYIEILNYKESLILSQILREIRVLKSSRGIKPLPAFEVIKR